MKYMWMDDEEVISDYKKMKEEDEERKRKEAEQEEKRRKVAQEKMERTMCEKLKAKFENK